jgi:hypothetical protein
MFISKVHRERAEVKLHSFFNLAYVGFIKMKRNTIIIINNDDDDDNNNNNNNQ